VGGESRHNRTVKAMERQDIVSPTGRIKEIHCKAALKP